MQVKVLRYEERGIEVQSNVKVVYYILGIACLPFNYFGGRVTIASYKSGFLKLDCADNHCA